MFLDFDNICQPVYTVCVAVSICAVGPCHAFVNFFALV